MPNLINPNTGETVRKVRVWFEKAGESPQRPYAVRRWYEDRYVVVKVSQAGEEPDELMTISTDHGETPEPWTDGKDPA